MKMNLCKTKPNKIEREDKEHELPLEG